MVIQYFIALVSEWAFWITSSIPAAIFVCLNYFYPNFVKSYWWVAVAFILLGLMVASYKAWAKERVKNSNLEKEIFQLKQNPVNYDVRCNLLGRINTDKNIDELNEEKLFVKRKIDAYSGEPKNYPDKILWLADIARAANLGLPQTDWEKYKKSLEKYESELIAYKEKTSNIFLVELIIENTGSIYDEKINIVIRPINECEFIKQFDLQKPDKPERPKSFLENLSNPPFLMGLPHIQPDTKRTPFREVQCFSKGYIEIDIRELRVNQEESIIPQGLYIKSNQSTLELGIEIKSKETRSPIHLSVKCKIV